MSPLGLAACLLAAQVDPGSPESPAAPPGWGFFSTTSDGRVEAWLARAFSNALEQSAEGQLRARGHRFATASTMEQALRTIRKTGCIERTCPSLAAQSLGLSYLIESTLVRGSGEACRAEVIVRGPERTIRRSAEIRPCAVDGLLVRGTSLGRALTAGPAFRPSATVRLTPRELPSLALATIPPIELRAVRRAPRSGAASASSTAGMMRPPPFEEAIMVYRQQAIFRFYDEEGRLRFRQGDRLLGECELRSKARAPIPPSLRAQCYGNGWVWALLGVPAGALLAWASFPSLQQEELAGFSGFSMGVATAAISGILGLTKMRFGRDPLAGDRPASHSTLRAWAEVANRRLRQELDLTEAEASLGPGIP